MKLKLFISVFAICMLMPLQSYSQFGGVVRRAVTRQVNNEIDSLLDKKVQDEQDKNRAKKAEEEKQAKEAQQAAPQAEKSGNSQAVPAENSQANASGAGAMGGLFGGKVTLKYDEEYSFTSRIVMVMEIYDNKETTRMDMNMFYSADNPSVGMETATFTGENSDQVKAKMVVDGKNKVMLMLTDVNEMKMGMISELPDVNTNITGPDGKPVKKYTAPVFTKTGNTRTVAGYKCDEYTYVNKEDNTTGKVWFTKEPKLKIDKRGWSSSGMSYYYGSNQFNDGIILASEAFNSKGKPESKMETKEINENYPYKISAAGYSLRQMNLNK